ncbi:hypothetical protein [Salana multivorans]
MLGALAVLALLVLYLVLVSQRAFALLGSGTGVGAVLGAAILLIPVLTVWFLGREVSQARAVDRLTARLAEEGGLKLDDLPRSPAGRIDRETARERFDDVHAAVVADPEDWRGWYRLGWAYDASGDRGQARQALRHAVRLERATR